MYENLSRNFLIERSTTDNSVVRAVPKRQHFIDDSSEIIYRMGASLFANYNHLDWASKLRYIDLIWMLTLIKFHDDLKVSKVSINRCIRFINSYISIINDKFADEKSNMKKIFDYIGFGTLGKYDKFKTLYNEAYIAYTDYQCPDKKDMIILLEAE